MLVRFRGDVRVVQQRVDLSSLIRGVEVVDRPPE